MAAIFISHSSEDNAQALALKEILSQIGFDNVFLDFDKHHGIPLGSDWERKLYTEMERCHAVLLVLTSNWLNSKWCFVEFAQARAMGKTIYVVLEKPAGAPGKIASDIQVCDLVSNREIGLARLHEELKSALLVAQAGFAFDERLRAPFPGLNAFEEQDAAVFFGRDPEISAVLERIKSERGRSKKALALVGGSGTGKSSLLKAGALPRLRRERHVDGKPIYLVAQMRPGERPRRAMLEALRGLDPTLMLEDLGAAVTPDGAWSLIDRLRMKAGAPRATLVIGVDQAEEMFSSAAEESDPFFALLGALVAGDNPARLILSLRSEHIDAAQRIACLADALDLFPVKPMPLDRLSAVVRGPARRLDFSVDDELVEAIRADAETEDALPLVAFVLSELYERYGRKSRRLEKAHYEAMRLGDLSPLESAVRRRAEETLRDASEAELAALRNAFTPGLVRLDEERAVFVRHDARLDQLPEPARPLIERLVDARLLVKRAAADDGVHVEVAHEALFRVWPKLAEWLDEDRDLLVRFQGLRRAAAEWRDRDAWLVHRGPRLQEAEDLAGRPDIAARLDSTDRAYLAACRKREAGAAAEAEARRREREEADARALRDAREITRRTRLGLIAALILASVAVVVGATAVWFGWQASQQKALAQAETRAAAQRSAILQAGAAHDLAEEGSVDAALLMLLDGARQFTDADAPDQLRIGFSQALEKTARAKNLLLPASTEAFMTHSFLFLYDSDGNDLSLVDSEQGPTLIHKGAKGESPIVEVIEGEKGVVYVVHKDMNIDIIKTSDKSYVHYGRFVFSPGTIDDSSTPFQSYPEALALLRLYHPSGAPNRQAIEVFDLVANATYEGVFEGPTSQLAADFIIKRSGDDLYFLGRDQPDKSLFKLALNKTAKSFKFASASPAEQKNIAILFDGCVASLPATVAANFIDVFRGTMEGLGRNFGCDKYGSSYLLRTNSHGSGGEFTTYELVIPDQFDQGQTKPKLLEDALRDELSFSLRNNPSWVTIESTTGTIAGAVDRDVFVFQSGGLAFNYKLPTPPSAGRFVNKDSLVVYQPDNGILTSLRLDNVLVPFQENVPKIAGGYRTLNYGNCVGRALPEKNSETLTTGLTISYQNPTMRGPSDTHKIVATDRGVAKEIELGKLASCVSISRDGKRMLVVPGEDVASGDPVGIQIYDLQKAAQTGVLAGAELGRIPLRSATSAFFIGDTGSVITAGGGYSVLKWDFENGEWKSRVIFHDDHEIDYAEPNLDGQLLIVIEDLRGSETAGQLYSLRARERWLDLGDDYKMLGAAFQSETELLVTKHDDTEVFHLPTLSQASAMAMKQLSPHCRVAGPAEVRKSPCWPSSLD